jgi:DNA primase catalytic core
MSDLSEWIKEELYPSLFDNIEGAFPEHQFKKFSKGWRSQTYLNGSKHRSRIDKTIIHKRAIYCITEQGGEALNLIKYVERRDSVNFITALKTLAKIAGIQLPKDDNFDEEYFKKERESVTIREAANSYFIFCLEKSSTAKSIRDYLSSRGYSPADIKGMELGYIPSQEKLNEYLIKKDYTEAQIKAALELDKRIGGTHSLTIPFRSGNNLKGFKFRTIGEERPKYLNSTNLDKAGGFFNLSGIDRSKELVIMEGELDSLNSSIKGIPNVVSTGGDSINKEQIINAKKKGVTKFILCFDYEKGKEEKNYKATKKAIDIILKEDCTVFVAQLPDIGATKTDPDSLIKEKEVKALQEALSHSLPHYLFTLNYIYQKTNNKGELSSKDITYFLEEIVTTGGALKPLERDLYSTSFLKLKGIKSLGISKESLEATLEELRYKKDREEQNKGLADLLKSSLQLQKEGKTIEALEELGKQSKQLITQDKKNEFEKLLIPIKEEGVKERLSNKPESLITNLSIGEEAILLPSGAISILAAPTSHGKTTLLLNLLINVATEYPKKQFHLFSYEEDKDSIIANCLNTFIGENLSGNNRRTIKSYYATGSEQYFSNGMAQVFKEKKEAFFKELIETNRINIHYVDYSSDLLAGAITFLKDKTNIGGVFIDYMQLLKKEEGRYNSRQEELKRICLDFKDLAVATGLPITLGAQFNREVVNQLIVHATKIGEAGDIERIANLILGFWNNDFEPIGTKGEIKEIEKRGMSKPNTIYSKILKNRGGRVGEDGLLNYHSNSGKINNDSYNNDLF